MYLQPIIIGSFFTLNLVPKCNKLVFLEELLYQPPMSCHLVAIIQWICAA